MTSNPNQIVSLQELRDAKEDVQDLGDALNTKQVITPRYGNPFNSLPLELDNLAKAIQIALAAGAGAAGWTDSLIRAWTGRTQEQENRDFITSAEKPALLPPTNKRFSYFEGDGIKQANGNNWNQVITGDRPTHFNHHLDLQCKFPWAFSDYEQQLSNFGLDDSTGYILNGGFTIVESDNSFWTIAGVSPGSTNNSYLRKYDLTTGAELGFYRLNTTSICEGLVITDYYGGWKAFVGGRQDGYINEFNISLNPDGSTLDIAINHFTDLYNQFAFKNGFWFCESKTPEFVLNTLRNVINIFDKDFIPKGSIKLPIWSSGHVTNTTNAYSSYLNKRQGFAIGDGYIVCAFGGAYDLSSTLDRTKYQGIKVYSFSGDLIHESMFDPGKMIGVMQEQLSPAYEITRVENEGVYVAQDGTIYTQIYYASRSQSLSQRKTDGVAIFKHKATRTSFDYSEATTITSFRNIGDTLYIGRYDSNRAINPITGNPVGSVIDIFRMMRSVGIPSVVLQTGGITTVTDIDGVTLIPAGTILIFTLRTLTSIAVDTVNIGVTSTAHEPYLANMLETDIWEKVSIPRVLGGSLLLKPQIQSDTYYGRILSRSFDGNPILSVDQQATLTSNLLTIGGGSSLYKSASEVRIATEDTFGPLGGTVRYRFTKTAFTPYVASTYTLGTNTLSWKSAYINDVIFKPSANITPANNGELVIEATSNTEVKIKLKGSDGVVRSAVLTLA